MPGLTSVARALTAAAVGVAAALAPASPASAAQHQNANLGVQWSFGRATGFWNIDQRVQITRKAPSSYWAMQWGFTATPNDGGYMGLQTNGLRFNKTTGDTAIFSLWNANATRGANCGSFAGEGTGLSCRLAYPVSTETDYRYRLWRLDADARGQWWGAWIMNLRTGVDTPVGQIRVDRAKTATTTPLNFSEYWGTAVPCGRVPLSTAYFTQPAANQLRPGVYQHGSRFARSTRGACTGGSATVVDLGWTKAARATLGGPL